MISIIKKLAFILLLFAVQGCFIGSNPSIKECVSKEITVAKVYEGGVKDIVFEEENGDFYYINRGLERGYTLEDFEKKVVNKKITLYIYTFWFGTNSNHITQLSLEDEILFTEL